MALERPPRRVPALAVLVGTIVVLTLAGLVTLWPQAPEVASEAGATFNATITQIEVLPVDEVAGEVARLTFEVDDGVRAGQVTTIDSQLQGLPDLAVGDGVVVGESGAGGDDLYIVDAQRAPALWWLVGLFVATVIVVGRWHGVRSLLGLGISLWLVIRFIVPGILAGTSPALVALVGALAIMLATLYLTHGVSARTTAAVVGTSVALLVTVGLAWVFIDWAAISGFASEEARFARVVVDGLDVAGLVLAGLIIAALGVLDDVTVAQAGTVWALHDTDPALGPTVLFRRAMAVGRDHIASTVNTLFLAYAGASLSLLVLFSTGGQPWGDIVRSEVVATEVVKTIVGSLGLISAVPLTTALAAVLAVRRDHDEVARSRRTRGGDQPNSDHTPGHVHG